MRRASKVPVEVDCEEMGLKKFPIAGYPLSYYKQNYDMQTKHAEGRCRFPSTPIHVQAYGSPTEAYRIPKYRLNYVNKYVDVPIIQKIQKVVEVPEIREITKFVNRVNIVDVPVDDIRMVPKLKIREIEKVRHIPGPVQYIEVPQEHIVHKPIKQVVEKIHEVPVIEDIEVEVPIYVPTPVGPPEDINIDIPLPYDVPQFCYRPDRLRSTMPPRTGCCASMCNKNLPTIEIGPNRHQMNSSPPLGYTIVPPRRNERNHRSNDRHNFADERLFNYDGAARNPSRNSVTRNSSRNGQGSRERPANSHYTFYPNENYRRDGYENYQRRNNPIERENREEVHTGHTCLAEEEPTNYPDDENNYPYEDNRNYIYGDEGLNNEETNQQIPNHVTAELIVRSRGSRRR